MITCCYDQHTYSEGLGVHVETVLQFHNKTQLFYTAWMIISKNIFNFVKLKLRLDLIVKVALSLGGTY